MTNNVVQLLLVDDDDVDVDVVKRGFKKQKIANPIFVAQNGIEALDILRGTNGKTKIQRPYVILLDLNMPRMNGLECLKEIRKDDQLRDSVVFILTTSENETDRILAYRENVAGYMLKSQVGVSFKEAISMLTQYWTVVVLPS